MAISEADLVGLIHDLTNPSVESRKNGCGMVEDWARSFTPEQLGLLARVLTVAALAERDSSCRECQLHAIAEISDLGTLSRDDVGGLTRLDKTVLDPSSLEYMDALREVRLLP